MKKKKKQPNKRVESVDHITEVIWDNKASNLKEVKVPLNININKYKPRGSYRGDSPLDD